MEIRAITGEEEYATQPQFLKQEIDSLLKGAPAPTLEGHPIGLVVPGMNLLAGGDVAAAVYRHVEGMSIDNAILIAPSHAGHFHRLSICSVDEYFTPIGSVPVDDRTRNELCDEDDDFYLDDTGHYQHEGIDVQLPFLVESLARFSIVPIIMGEESPELGSELGTAVGEMMHGRRSIVVACADLLEGSPEGLQAFCASFEALDAGAVRRTLQGDDVRFFGGGAIDAAMMACRRIGARAGHVIAMTPPEGSRPGFFGAVIVA